MTRFAVFDCDGTLVDGQADVCDTMEEAFKSRGFTRPDRNEVRRLVGLSLPIAIAQLLPNADDDECAGLVERYKELFRARRTSGQLHEPLYSGMAELLAQLHSDGWLLAVATGKSQRGLEACLETHGITELFCSLQTADGHPSKPHPAMLEAALFESGAAAKDAVMIGDTSFDMEMGRAAGVHAIGVEWGYHTKDDLRNTGAANVARNIVHLGEILAKFGEARA
ncbi:MAG: HAD-IA family hydrolase [Erythrobacter sp.]